MWHLLRAGRHATKAGRCKCVVRVREFVVTTHELGTVRACRTVLQAKRSQTGAEASDRVQKKMWEVVKGACRPSGAALHCRWLPLTISGRCGCETRSGAQTTDRREPPQRRARRAPGKQLAASQSLGTIPRSRLQCAQGPDRSLHAVAQKCVTVCRQKMIQGLAVG